MHQQCGEAEFVDLEVTSGDVMNKALPHEVTARNAMAVAEVECRDKLVK